MHSKIYEMIEEENYGLEEFSLSPSCFFDDNSNGFDYVSDDTDREEDIEWLFSSLEKTPYLSSGKDEKGFFIEIKESARRELTNEIWAELNKLYEDYTRNSEASAKRPSEGMLLHRMKRVISDEFSFRFWNDGTLDTFQSFITDYKPGRFYIGNTLDYHY